MINGILLLDKPLYLTSNRVLQRVKRLFGAKKAGHTGSLDPLATGMLPICFGKATKCAQYLLDSDKYYRVSAKLGVTTRTGDAEGDILKERPIPSFTEASLMEVLSAFTGTISQTPPMYSAIKHQGKPLYLLARKGLVIERKAREVKIHALKLEGWDSEHLHLYVHCSKGTYIRTLVEDIGEVLQCGAHVSALRRLAVAPYQEENMVSLATLEEQHEREGSESLSAYLLPAEVAIPRGLL
jgi:tRNA pseudouridine55 synthase